MIVTDLLRRGVKLYPDQTAIHYQGNDLSYKALNQRATRLANALLEKGMHHGDRIAILALNSDTYFELCMACGKIGVVFIPLNARLLGEELKYIINNGKARALFVDSNFLGLINSIRKALPSVEHYISLNQAEQAEQGFEDYGKLISGASDSDPDVEVRESDIFCQMYTSGTTGKPKGAMLSHHNLLSTAATCSMEHDIKKLDRYLMVMPFFHVGGLVPALSALTVGAALFVYPAFVPQDVLKVMGEKKITHAALVVAMIQFLLSIPGVEDHDYSSLRYIIYGGSAISPDLLKKAMSVFQCSFIQGYGLTEAASFATLLRHEDHILEGSEQELERLKSIGKEILGVEVKVVNDKDEDIQPGEMGEIIIKGNGVMAGYWDLPEATADALREGWFYTGDMGTIDKDGFIYAMERKKDMIISGGENIYSREIEDVLYTHPAIAESVVIGVPDPVWGESVKAVVVAKDGQTVTEQEIIDFCSARLAGYKKPKSVDFVKDLPRTPAGKVLKRILREPYWAERDRGIN